MAPGKRDRQSLEDEASETSSSDEQTSKRQRTSGFPVESEHLRSSSTAYGDAPLDSEDDEDDSEQEIDERAPRRSGNRSGDGADRAAQCGVIESVTCYNFMCHVHLSVTLGPSINFIIGHNGSGKSAILTAITLCLGGKASTTNRGQALKSFIRNGAETSTIAVKLKNGDGGYRRELFGNSIIVERTFSVTGWSGFKLKSGAGRTISTKKSELDQVTDFFALQIDNPLNVLSQDLSRHFLNSSSAADKYRFFIRGVQLEQLDTDYKLIEQSIDQIEPQLVVAKEGIEQLEREMKAAKERFIISERSESLLPRIQELSNQMAWAQVEEQEALLEKFKRQMLEAQRSVEKAVQSNESVMNAVKEAEKALSAGQAEVEKAEQELEPVMSEKDELSTRVRTNRTALSETQTTIRAIREEMVSVKARKKDHERKVTAEQTRLKEMDGGKLESLMDQIDEARREADRLKTEQAEHASGRPELEQQKGRIRGELLRAQTLHKAKENEMRKGEEVIRSLERDRGNHLQAFGPNMAQLLQKINDEHGFREKPVGPVGQHITLKDHKWLGILDKSFGNLLNSFIVTSKADQSLLQQILRQGNHPYQILIGKRMSIDTSQHEPDPKYRTTLRELVIDDDLVRTQLIINQSIEQTLLIESMQEGMEVMNTHPPPANVKQCYCLHPHKIGSGVRIGLRAGGREVGTAPVEPNRGASKFRVDVQSQIDAQHEIMDALRAETRSAKDLLQSLTAEQRRVSGEIDQHGAAQLRLKRNVQRVEHRKSALEDEREAATADDGRLTGLERMVEEIAAELETQQAAYGEAVVSKDELNVAANALKAEVDELNGRLRGLETTKIKAQKTYEQLKQDHVKAKRREEKEALDANVHRNKVESLRMQIEQQRTVIEEFETEASKVSLRVPVPEGQTPEMLEAKMQSLDRERERFEQEMGASKKELARLALSKTDAFDVAYKEEAYTRLICELLKKTLSNRKKRWQYFRKSITAHARRAFNFFLQERGFSGNMSIEHKKRVLELYVQPDETQRSRGSGTKGLSGGEKSFSTISFLLALWDAMGSPIRCLDEFDVFMDNVNRDVAMNMMIEAARQSSSKQYILITPNSMGNLRIGEDTRVIRLTDPERGQTALPFVSAPT